MLQLANAVFLSIPDFSPALRSWISSYQGTFSALLAAW